MTLLQQTKRFPTLGLWFSFYRAGTLWYVTECGFEFPVPIEEIGEATFLSTDKAMLFMRYIRKHLATAAEAVKARDALIDAA